ncbi:hypothetical protein [Dyadobacter psychrotolerans]|nr:hypothetical protein [Dyadobacter psychrotolerans]
MEIPKNKHEKQVLLVGKAQPVVRGAWRKMGDFFNENAVYKFLFVLKGKAYFKVDMIYQDLESDFWCYDPSSNVFTPKQRLPTKDGGSVMMAIGEKGYYGPGLTFFNGDYTNVNSMWEYNPDTDVWSRKADFIVPEIEFPGIFVIGSNAYVCGWQSKNGYRYIADTYQYNSVSDSWSKKDGIYSLSRLKTTQLQFGFNGKGYLFGGGAGPVTEFGKMVDSLYVTTYSPQADRFTTLKTNNFPYDAAPQTSWIIGNSIFFYLGGKDYNFYTFKNEIWEFNTSNLTWKKNPDFTGPIRHGAFGFSVGDKAYICFGDNTGLIQYDDIWEYNP